MRNQSEISEVKSVAMVLLQTDIHETKFSPMVVQHPFTSSGIVGLKLGGEFQMLDITRDQENLLLWQSQMQEQIESAETPFEVFMLVNKPYGLTFLKHAAPYLSQEDFSKILVSAWMISEYPNEDDSFSKRSLVSLFEDADPKVLMDADERQELETLGSPVTVYRGVTPYNEKNIQALSWTLKYETAEWFASRFGEGGTVYKAQIDKDYIFALLHGRNEAEVIVDPKHLMNIEPAQAPVMENTLPAWKNELTMGGIS